MTPIHPFPQPLDPREQAVVQRDEYPQTDESIARAKAFQRAERLANGLDMETGQPLRTRAELMASIERHAAAVTAFKKG